ncbi:MAG: hypothetical protein B7Y39_12320 [Bdellovibrio sp. 28-41-41]|nr:MAG: hypothetical protein B7Y39_12320 [Bdellovibrio sp. 28-41-41]
MKLTEEDKSIILKQVPIYAAMKIGADGASSDQYSFRVFSNEPRNTNNTASKEEMEIFSKFENDPNLKELVSETTTAVTVYRAVRLSESRGCLTCHGNPSTSPWGNGKDILGYKMENWKDGKLHGVFAVSNDIPTVLKAHAQAGGASSTTMLSLFIFLGAVLALVLGAFIINTPIKTLTNLASTLSHIGEQVTVASAGIASSSQQLSEASTEQAASLEETAASLEEITSMISKATENAQNTSETSSESHKKAEEGRESVDQMLSSMDEISQSNEAILTQINESNRQMSDIVKVIQDIGNRTKVINEIVFQTKLLSFNASVEAARAGEHGKGFAVVAEEVGNLAQMSGNAAKEITDMLDASISKVEGIVRNTQQKVEGLIQSGKEKVDSGVTVAKQCSDVLNEIVQNVSRVSGLSLEISQAAKEQAQGVSEINKAMSQLDTVTQQNAATSEEAASAAEELSGQAESLKESVEELMAVITGNRNSSTSPQASRPVPTVTKSPKSNIVHIKATMPKVKKSSSFESKSLQKASGDDSSMPNRDDDGFKDV